MKSLIFITFAQFKFNHPSHIINMKIKRLYVAFGLTVGILFSSCQSKMDLIVHNANVYTMGQSKSKASAFVVNEGKFVDVGGKELLERYTAKKVLDLQELPVYPGFIDSHCHFLSLGLSLNKVDLVGTKSFEEVLDRVKSYATNK
jgi:predicted amidohydrolase YtcJ